MLHIIDHTDHYAHGDNSINLLNFLKYEDRTWALMTANALLYTNRLRAFEHIALLEKAGFRLEYEDHYVHPRSKDWLKDMKICRKYQNVSIDELSKTISYLGLVPN